MTGITPDIARKREALKMARIERERAKGVAIREGKFWQCRGAVQTVQHPNEPRLIVVYMVVMNHEWTPGEIESFEKTAAPGANMLYGPVDFIGERPDAVAYFASQLAVDEITVRVAE